MGDSGLPFGAYRLLSRLGKGGIDLGEELAGDTPWLTLFTAPPARRPQAETVPARRPAC